MAISCVGETTTDIVATSNAWAGGAPKVGQRAEMSRLVKPEYIELFSEISGDYNPVHYDEAVARTSPFGEIIVQGTPSVAQGNATGGS